MLLKVSSSKKKIVLCALMKVFKNDEKCFLFHLKSSCRPENIDFFVLNLR